MADSIAPDDAVRAVLYELLTAPAISLARPYPLGAARNVPVFDETGGTAGFPYITLGASEAFPVEEHGRFGWLVRISVHGWSDYQGYAEVSAVERAVTARLHRRQGAWPAAFDQWEHISMTVSAARKMRDEDTRYRHGVMDVVVRLTQKEE